jgi:hypothetical protein
LHHFPLRAVFSAEARYDMVTHSVPERHVISYINQIAGTQSRVVFIETPQGAGLKGYPLYAEWYNPRLQTDIRTASSSDELMARLAKHGATHVLIKFPVSATGRQPLPNGKFLIEGLSKQAVLRAQLNAVDLYELHPHGAPTIVR